MVGIQKIKIFIFFWNIVFFVNYLDGGSETEILSHKVLLSMEWCFPEYAYLDQKIWVVYVYVIVIIVVCNKYI